MDMIVADESPSQISDKIKDLLFAKTAEKVDTLRPGISNYMFNTDDELESEEEE